MYSTAIVIPIYNEVPTIFEDFNIKNNIKKLDKYDIYFIHSECISNSYYKKHYKKKYIKFPKELWDNTIGSYNRLCLRHELYDKFKKYDYILICQTDAYVFNYTSLDMFINMNYDYIGGPVMNSAKDIYKGYIDDFLKNLLDIQGKYLHLNGGLSLRKVSKFIEATKYIEDKDIYNISEDIVFSTINYRLGKLLFRIPEYEICKFFSTDSMPHYEHKKQLFGCHGYNKLWSEVAILCLDNIIKEISRTRMEG